MNSKLVAALAPALVLTFALPAWSADPAPKVQPATLTTPEPTDEQVISQFRSDLLAKSADVMAKGLTLTADQASKFWPLFQQYQKEQEVVINEQIEATKHYAEHFQTLNDQDALVYVKSLLHRDQAILDLRTKWLEKFQKVVPAKTAARAIQLDRRLGNVAQIQMSSQIPLVKQSP